MRNRNLITATVAVAALGGGALVLTAAGGGGTIETVDFAKRVTATQPAFDARLAPASDANIKEFRIPIKDATIEIAKGVTYEGWTFGGTVPGPTLRVRVGDSVRVTVVNESPIPHSIDFHAARIPANVAYRMIMPRDSVSFAFLARDAGAFMVHCGTPPVTMHLMQGMYLPIIVDPQDGWGTKADKEFVLVQSEFYAKAGDSTKVGTMLPMQPDWQAERAKNATYVAFNGRAGQYKDNPLRVDVGDRVRFFVVNAGPNFDSDFHVVGAVFDRVYPDGNPKHVLEGVQTYGIPAGGGAVFEAVFAKDASGEGLYPFVTHSFADAEKGAVGIIQVGVPKQFARMSH
ncbi:MAG TPA: multicopper oxidase domain-containing protein [Gemmatimonadaceae bacterium]|jgi:nitrite reductase (NO-forming)|nr:multicopper oxidase domain-containing protein [Gemmatimonadaceae bacterium]